MSIVRMTLADLPPMTDKDRARLKRLAALPDDQIDLSDAPEMTDEQFATAERYNWRDRAKTPVTIRLDAEVVDWFKAHATEGRGYQTEINRVLREYVGAAA